MIRLKQRVPTIAIAVLLGVPIQVVAQQRVHPGDSVRVWVAGAPPSLVLGRVLLIDGDALILGSLDQQTRYARSLVADLHRYHPPQRALYAAVGAGTFGLLWASLATATPPSRREAGGSTLGDVAIGLVSAGAGALIGLVAAEARAGWKPARLP